jgi:hypothetical protein
MLWSTASRDTWPRRKMPERCATCIASLDLDRHEVRTLFPGDEYGLVAVIWVDSFQYWLQSVGERIQAKPAALDL